MLIRDFIELPLPLDRAVDGMADPRRWAAALHGQLGSSERTLLARFGVDGLFPTLGKDVEVRLGPPRRHERGTVIDVQWQPADWSGWYPVMQGDVSLSALSSARTHVEFNGSYTPPAGVPGRVADRLMLHHVAEHAVRLVLTRLAEELSGQLREIDA
jgi:hypothetical protein